MLEGPICQYNESTHTAFFSVFIVWWPEDNVLSELSELVDYLDLNNERRSFQVTKDIPEIGMHECLVVNWRTKITDRFHTYLPQ